MSGLLGASHRMRALERDRSWGRRRQRAGRARRSMCSNVGGGTEAENQVLAAMPSIVMVPLLPLVGTETVNLRLDALSL